MSVPEHLRCLRRQVENLRPVPTSAHGVENVKFNVPKSLTDAQFVYVRRDGKSAPLQTPYDGPFRVLGKGPKSFKLQLGTRTDIVSIDRLKPAITEGEVEVALPPRRGRPPNSIVNLDPQGSQQTQIQNTLPVPVQAGNSTAKTTTIVPENKPSYAEVTSRCGRTIKPPNRLMY